MTEATLTGVSGDPSARALTVREAKFVEFYCQTQSVAEAGRKAGVGRGNSTAYRMYAEPAVRWDASASRPSG
jgi:hypothetical protein